MPTLTSVEEMAAEGTIVKPLLHQFLTDRDSDAGINILVRRPAQRGFDGRFHASSHPTATDYELYLWLTGQAQGEDFSYAAQCAMLFGSLFHGVFEAFLDWTGHALPLGPGDCPACGKPRRPVRARPSFRYCTEHGFTHPETRASCHLDAIMSWGSTPAAWDLADCQGLDLKTCHPYALKGVRDMDEEQFRAKWPKYWAQGQECMRISGLRQYVFLFMTMGSPWDTREFHFGFDPAFAVETEEKYRRVISHVERGVPIVA